MREEGEDGGSSPKRARCAGPMQPAPPVSVFPLFSCAAVVARPETHVDTWEDAWNIVQQQSGLQVFFDEERKRVLAPIIRSLDCLERGELHGNGCCRLLIGVKGIGKSTLLSLLAAANAFVHRCTLSIYIETPVDFLMEGYTLFDVIRESIFSVHTPTNGQQQQLSSLGDLLKWLCSAEYPARLFLVVDEVDELFKLREGRAWIRDLRRLANLRGERTVYVIVSGSSAHLRPLFYALVPVDEKMYPGYDGVSCNSTKFRPITLRRPQTLGDFRLAINAISKKYIDDDELVRLFIDCRGILRDAEAEVEQRGADVGAFLFEKILVDDDLQQLFRRLYRRVSGSGKGDIMETMHISCTIKDLLHDEQNGAWNLESPLPFMYQCADDGYVDFEPDPTTGRSRVSFPHPAFYAMASSLDEDLSFEEVVSLLYPFSRHGLVVERLVLESLAYSLEYAWHSAPIKCTEEAVRAAEAVDLKSIVEQDSTVATIFKAGSDNGIDGIGVKLLGDETRELELLCVQVKMQGIEASSQRTLWKRNDSRASSSESSASVDAIVTKLREEASRVEAYCSGMGVCVRCTLCLVTNRNVSAPARAYLAEQEVRLVDRSALYGIYTQRIRRYVDRNRLEVHGYGSGNT